MKRCTSKTGRSATTHRQPGDDAIGGRRRFACGARDVLIRTAAACITSFALCAPLHANGVDGAAVDRAIEHGIKALMDATVGEDVITFKTRQKGGLVRTVRGHVEKDHGARIDFRTVDGEKVSIRKILIDDWQESGYLKEEMTDYFRTGPTTLAAFALVAAGVETRTPQLARMLGALERADTKNMGTYVRSLRACLWSLLLDRKLGEERHQQYRRLLQQDITWLMHARTTQGAHTYFHPREMDFPGDNSNTQFAHLGLWAGAVAGADVSNSVWLAMEKYWLGGQEPDGGWAYVNGNGGSTSSMTVAGCNSLYIVLDRHYARADFPYRYFEGARPNKKARARMDRIYRAIDDGNAFLTHNRPSIAGHRGYELFGLERLGLASGRTHIGGLEWFERYVTQVADHKWGENAVADSFMLIFLVHGRAPVLFQKLAHGEDVHAWNYYHRDLSGLVRYLSGNFERIHRWQIVPETASLDALKIAPFLYISGFEQLKLSEATRRTIRDYIDEGGVVFLHADRSSARFVESAKKMFNEMFADRRLEFSELDRDEPLYTCLFRGGRKGWKKRVPFTAIREGPRLMVLLSPVDLAGAWHQDRREHNELYEIMANVRVYCAPPYNELPQTLPPLQTAAGAVAPRGSLRLYQTSLERPTAYAGLWQRHAEGIQRRTGMTLRVEEGPLPDDAAELAGFDVVHVSTRGASDPGSRRLRVLSEYARNGGWIMIDAADGQGPATAAVLKLVEGLDVGERGVLAAKDALAIGSFDGGRSLLDLDSTQAGLSLSPAKAPPPIVLRTVEGRVAVAACPFDLSAGLNGHFVWQRVGYTQASTRTIVDNLLLSRWWQLREARGAAEKP